MSVDNLKTNIKAIQQRISSVCVHCGRAPDEITLVAVSKTVTAATIRVAYDIGIRHFGENRLQEAEKKIKELGGACPEITWHMIGHLQSNKVKNAVELFDIVHSIDSIKLAEAVNFKTTKILPVLLQVNVAAEETKSGFSVDKIRDDFNTISKLPNLEIKGLMTIAPITNDPEETRPVFRKLRKLRDELGLKELSMGMTEDFEVAIEEGATIIRIGRAIFGERG